MVLLHWLIHWERYTQSLDKVAEEKGDVLVPNMDIFSENTTTNLQDSITTTSQVGASTTNNVLIDLISSTEDAKNLSQAECSGTKRW